MTNPRRHVVWNTVRVNSGDAVRAVFGSYDARGRYGTYSAVRARIFDVVDDRIYLLITPLDHGGVV